MNRTTDTFFHFCFLPGAVSGVKIIAAPVTVRCFRVRRLWLENMNTHSFAPAPPCARRASVCEYDNAFNTAVNANRQLGLTPPARVFGVPFAWAGLLRLRVYGTSTASSLREVRISSAKRQPKGVPIYFEVPGYQKTWLCWSYSGITPVYPGITRVYSGITRVYSGVTRI